MKEDYNAFTFDLDGTLAVTKSALTEDVSQFICKLLSAGKSVGIISGGWMPQFEKQFLGSFNCPKKYWKKLYLMPTSGAAMYKWNGQEWKEEYSYTIPEEDVKLIIDSFNNALNNASFERPQKLWGEQIENRVTQITFSALGQVAPPEKKEAWDKDNLKKQEIADAIAPLLPKYTVKVGGTTSVDITLKGIDKGFGMEKFFEISGHTKDDTLFTGDRIYEGGNDYEVVKTGVDTCQVDDYKDMIKKLNKYVN